MASTGLKPTETTNSKLRRRGRQNEQNDDLELLKEAHSVSFAINEIVKNNSLQNDYFRSLDEFTKSIEERLDAVEQYFNENDDKKLVSADSTASLQNLYDTLIAVKSSSFSDNNKKLERFDNIVNEHYKHLMPIINTSGHHLDFHEKVLTSLHFIDAKINQFNSIVEDEANYLLNRKPGSLEPEKPTVESIKEFQIKFYNYEHCLTEGSSRLLHYFELPFPWRDNPYIVYGYRFHNNHIHSLKSVCELHNETGNIWTHLFGAFCVMYIALFTYPKSELYERSGFYDNLVVYFYLCSALKCLLSSSLWHTLCGSSNLYMRQKFNCIDYTGITVLITAAVVTTEYSALYYFPRLRNGFISFSLACGIFGFFFNWSPSFRRTESKPFRIGFYIALAGLGGAAFSILAMDKGLGHALKFYFPIVRSNIWYLIGVVFYSSLVPEKFRTDVILDVDQLKEDELVEKVNGNIESYFKVNPVLTENSHSIYSLWWIDYIFSSHNIWHVFVLLGAWGHYTATYEMFMNIPSNK